MKQAVYKEPHSHNKQLFETKTVDTNYYQGLQNRGAPHFSSEQRKFLGKSGKKCNISFCK